MSRTVIFLALLFAVSYCVEKKTNYMNQIIDELVELNTQMHHHKPNAFLLLKKIAQSAKESARAFVAFYRKVKANCKRGVRYIRNFMQKLKGDYIVSGIRIRKAKKRIKYAKKHAHRLRKKIAKSKKRLRKAAKRHARSAFRFRKALTEAEGKLVVIKHVRNIVVDELLNGRAPKPSLLQVNTITTKLQQLKTMVEKDDDVIFSTLVETLIQMASLKNLSDQRILRKFLRALAKLASKIRRWRKLAFRNRRRIKKIYKKSFAARLRVLRAMGRLLIQFRSTVLASRRAISDLKNTLKVIARALKRKRNEFKNWILLCSDQKHVGKLFAKHFLTMKRKLRHLKKYLGRK